MKKSQATISILLALAIGYGAGYYTHLIRLPLWPGWLHPTSAPTAPEPSPTYQHPLIPEIERARQLQRDGKLTEAQKLLRDQLHLYPQAAPARAARELLGSINTELFFSDKSLYGKTEYIVERGDSLARIARKLKSTPDLIMRVNSLESTLIHPGDRLLIPDDEFTVTIDLPNERAVVHHGDGYFKQYPIQAVDLPPSSQPRISTQVNAIAFWKDGERIAANTAEASEATPWINLSRPGYVLYGVSEPSGVEEAGAVGISEEQAPPKTEGGTAPQASANPDIPPRGIALLKDDLIELQMLLRRGTPVTIIRDR